MPDTPAPPDTGMNLNVRLMEPREADAIAALLADATTDSTPEAAHTALTAHGEGSGSAIFAVTLDDDLAAAYILGAAQMSVELVLFAVRPELRRRGLGRIILTDALRRAGHRPMVAETDEATMPFFTKLGFKKFGRRKGTDGSIRYRLGWHSPGQRTPTEHDAQANAPTATQET